MRAHLMGYEMAIPPSVVHDHAPLHGEAARDIARLTIRTSGALGELLGRELFSVPALDMLLDLYARADCRPMSLTGLCGATSAPPRTALNMINRMVDRGILERAPDPDDGRRILVRFSPEGVLLVQDICRTIFALWRPPNTAV